MDNKSRLAYNSVKRKNALKALVDDKSDLDLNAYFCTIYKRSSDLVMYGPNYKTSIIQSDEGIRQGDAPSSFFFCLLMEKVCRIINEKYKDSSHLIETLCFMDDNTIICDPEIARAVVDCAIQAAEECGFKVNLDKSSIICKNPVTSDEDSTFPISISNCNEEFRMLGINITDHFTEYNNSIIKRVNKFFDSLDNIQLHPELKHLILSMCGSPKLLYYCMTTPKEFGLPVVQLFQQRLKQSFAKLIDISDLSQIRSEVLHHQFGGRIPDYETNYDQIYNRTKNSIESGMVQSLMVKLINSSPSEAFTSPECDHDRQWTHYVSSTAVKQLSPLQYRTALAVRCRLLPDNITQKLPQHYRCDCEKLLLCRNVSAEDEKIWKENNKQELLLEHVMNCTAIHKRSFTERHDGVKEALRYVANKYGIHVMVEPSFYTYSNGQHNRPDLTFCVVNRPYVATDITVVGPTSNNNLVTMGQAAHTAAEAKRAKHAAAVNAMNHQFIPFALETTGHFDSGCFDLINALKNTIPFESRIDFVRDIKGAVSTALAEYRAEVLIMIKSCMGKS